MATFSSSKPDAEFQSPQLATNVNDFKSKLNTILGEDTQTDPSYVNKTLPNPVVQTKNQPGFFKKAGDLGYSFLETIAKPVEGIVSDIQTGSRIQPLLDQQNSESLSGIKNIQSMKQKLKDGEITKEQYKEFLKKDYKNTQENSLLPYIEGEIPSTEKVIGDSIGTVLTFAPILKGLALTGSAAGIGGNVAQQGVKELVKTSLIRGSTYGAAFSGAEAMSDEKSTPEVLQQALIGGLIGGALDVGGSLVFKYGKQAAQKVFTRGAKNSVLEEATTKADDVVDDLTDVPKPPPEAKVSTPETINPNDPGFIQRSREFLRKAMPNVLRSTYARLEQDYGEVGKKIASSYKSANLNAQQDVGKAMYRLEQSGIFKASDDDLWRKSGSLLDQLEGNVAASADDPIYQVSDRLRKDIAYRAQDKIPNWQGLDKYYPHNIPNMDVLKSGKVREDILENLVLRHGVPESTSAAGLLDDYVSFVESGGKLGTGNKTIQYMLESGQADTIEEARGKLLRIINKTPTDADLPKSRFLENSREVNLPFYDPNPKRTLPLYAMDAYRRLNVIDEFGPKDKILNELLGKIADQDGVEAAKTVDTLSKELSGIIQDNHDIKNWAKVFLALNKFRLSTSAFINLAQSTNELLVSDFGPWLRGIKAAFTAEGKSKALQAGSVVDNFMRNNVLDETGQGIGDRYMKWIGFTQSENFNRVAATNVGVQQAEHLAGKLGLQVDDSTKKSVTGMLNTKKSAQEFLGNTAMEERNKAIDAFNKNFPLPYEDPKFALKSVEGAQGRLDRLEEVVSKKTESLQKLSDSLDRAFKKAGSKDPSVRADTADLEESIKLLKQELGQLDGDVVQNQVSKFDTTPEEIQKTLEIVTGLRKKELKETLKGLEAELKASVDENIDTLASGESIASDVTEKVTSTPRNNQERLVFLQRKREEVQQAIVKLQNELTDRERLLQTVIDPKPVAESITNAKFPNRGEYDDYLKKNAAQPKEFDRSAESQIKELLGDKRWEEAKARGFLTEDDKLAAGLKMSEWTQFHLGDSGNLPQGFASSSLGKTIFQFKQFGYQQARFMKDILLNQLQNDRPKFIRNILLLGSAFPLTSEVLLDLRSLVTQEKRPTVLLDRYLQDLSMISGFGLITDTMKSAQQGRLAEAVLGPTFGKMADVGETVVQGVTKGLDKGNWEPLLKNLFEDVLQAFGGVGRAIQNQIIPPKGKKNEKSFLQSIFGNLDLSTKSAYAAENPNQDLSGRLSPNYTDISRKQLNDRPDPKASMKQFKQAIGYKEPKPQKPKPVTIDNSKYSGIDPENPNIISGFDLTAYATDPNHEKNVRSIYQSIPKLTDAKSITNHMKRKFPNTPITGEMVMSAVKEFPQVDPKLLIAIMTQDSGLGTVGKGARNKNPGNYATTDDGRIFKFKTWTAGVRGAALGIIESDRNFKKFNKKQLTSK